MSNFATNMPPLGPSPGPNAYWPLPKDKLKKVPSPSLGRDCWGRCVGASRDSGARCHCGVDLLAKENDPVVAIEDGNVVSMYEFLKPLWCIVINHGGYCINYGEIYKSSIEKFELTTGSRVKAGSQIAIVGRLNANQHYPMLHLEMYKPGTKYNSQWKSFPGGAPPSSLYDITNFLRALAGQPSVTLAEPIATDPCR